MKVRYNSLFSMLPNLFIEQANDTENNLESNTNSINNITNNNENTGNAPLEVTINGDNNAHDLILLLLY